MKFLKSEGSSTMTSMYIQNILEQPASLNATMDSIDRLPYTDQYYQKLQSGEIRRVVLTGMGSSYHALHPLLIRLTQENIMAQMIETSELVHFMGNILQPSTLVIAVSQSGQSAETIQLLKLCNGKVPIIGITNTKSSPLAIHSDTAIITQAGDEHSVSCKTYVSALAALTWIGDRLIGTTDEFSKIIEAPRAVADYLAHCEDHVQWFLELMNGINKIFLVGRGASLSAVGTGALIIKESSRFAAEGMSCAAFRHGPMETTSSESMLVVYKGTKPTEKLNVDLYSRILELGGKSVLICTSPELNAITLPPIPIEAMPILEILPAQMLSVALARLHGIIPGDFIFGNKITSTE